MRLRKEDGSITLEAAMVLPVFMLFVVFMASIIRISIAETALNKSVSETAEVIATHAYPATILTEQAKTIANSKLAGISINEFNLSDVEKLAGTTFREQFDIDISGSNFLQQLGSDVLSPLVKKKFADNVDSFAFDNSNIQVDVELPGSINGSSASYIGITATYDMDLTVPFVDRTITLKKKAYERLWVGGM
ncbi:TadE/TadG family type IV pilus assembly protein [Oceanobacillus kapialis]|uniref:TadE/TadG family type IV pilus assembly protein n=1 Tax=Oceanobacillus kapialis TaxID=481353 RepID=A0ABW5Q5S5_9BACI